MAARWIWLIIALGVSVPIGSSPLGAQPRVRVQAETRIELGTSREADHIVLRGALRDDLGSPIAAEHVHVRLSHARSRQSVLSRDVATDDAGRFAVVAPVTTGDYELRAIFDGGDYYQRTEVSRSIDLDRADVRLGVDVPNSGHLDLDVPTHPIEVRASCHDLGPGGIEVALLDEVGRTLAVGVTDGEGRVSFRVASSALGEPGAGRLKARSRPDAARAEAQTEVPIVRVRRSSLTLEAEPTRLRGDSSVTLGGELFDSQGPLPGRAIGLFDESGTHLATVLTDAEGRYLAEVSFAEREAGGFAVLARFESDAPGRDTIESEPITLTIDAPSPSTWLWAALPIAICLLLLFLIARRAPQRLTAVPPPPPPAPSGISAAIRSTRWQAHSAIAGRVIDRIRGTPLGGAEVTLAWEGGEEQTRTTAGDGTFSFEEPRAGEHLLRVAAPSYAVEETRVSSPHRGEWGAVTVRLESLRDRILMPYRKLAMALLPSSRLWEIWTNREIIENASASNLDPTRLGDLSQRVEEGFYSAHGPSAEEVDLVRREAEEAYTELIREPSGSPSPARENDEPTAR